MPGSRGKSEFWAGWAVKKTPRNGRERTLTQNPKTVIVTSKEILDVDSLLEPQTNQRQKNIIHCQSLYFKGLSVVFLALS
jgi:hypothetical protein